LLAEWQQGNLSVFGNRIERSRIERSRATPKNGMPEAMRKSAEFADYAKQRSSQLCKAIAGA